MHSALQAEFRLTQRLIRASCQKCSQRTQSPRRSFHRTRTIQASQGPRNDAGSQTPVPPPEDSNTSNKDKPEIVNEKSTAFPSLLPPPSHISTQDGGGAPEEFDPTRSFFHGSSENRRRRVRAFKELPEPAKPPPDWFVENNANLWGQGSLEHDSLSLHLDDPYKLWPESSPGSKPDGSHPVTSQEGHYETPYSWTPLQKLRHRLGSGAEKSTVREREYHVDQHQYLEIDCLLRSLVTPAKNRDVQHEPAVKKSHLLLHYAGGDGDYLVDELVRDYTRQMCVDLITLDVQDIAELMSSLASSDVASDARMLSYAVLDPSKGRYDASASMSDENDDVEDMEEDDDGDVNPFGFPTNNSQMGMPMMIGKPITIDLSSVFGGKQGAGGQQKMSEMFKNSMQNQRPFLSPFTAIVDGLLSSHIKKREQLNEEDKAALAEKRENFSQKRKSKPSTDAVILQVKDVKAIQELPLGAQFLDELYQQVQKRRSAGESMLLIGTECSRNDDSVYTPAHIKDMQRLRPDEISRTVVITPYLPNTASKLTLKHDTRCRTALINLRHLWETIKIRYDEDFLGLKAGFWTPQFYDDAFPARTKVLQYLAAKVLSFSDIQRVAAHFHYAAQTWESDSNLDSLADVQLMLELIDKSKTRWAAENTKSRSTKVEVRKPKEDPKLAKIRSTASKHEKKLMSGVIEADKMSTTFNDVHAPIETIESLQTLTTLSLIRPDAFKYGVLASDKIPGLLLYGPPGTGKTLLAKAVAKESGATMLEVSAADINDMYVGEGEKNVKALFSLAKKLSPCVVFLDEADAMFSARSNHGRRVSHRELLNQFLKEWDGMSNDSGSAFIMVATNRPHDLDDAVLRRLPRRLLVDLPTEQDRKEILKIHLRNEALADEVSIPELAKKTPLYSGSDLKNLAVAAALSAVREENAMAKAYKEKGEEGEYEYPEKRTLTNKHFEVAIDEITASVSEDMASLKDIKKFDEQYGDRKGRKKKQPKWGFKSAKEAEKVLDTAKVRTDE